MFTWERVDSRITLDALVRTLNQHMIGLRQLLRGVTRVGLDFRVRDRVRSGVGFGLAAQAATPSTPAAGEATLFLRDNGAGKMQLCIVYPSGAVGTLHTEP